MQRQDYPHIGKGVSGWGWLTKFLDVRCRSWSTASRKFSRLRPEYALPTAALSTQAIAPRTRGESYQYELHLSWRSHLNLCALMVCRNLAPESGANAPEGCHDGVAVASLVRWEIMTHGAATTANAYLAR